MPHDFGQKQNELGDPSTKHPLIHADCCKNRRARLYCAAERVERKKIFTFDTIFPLYLVSLPELQLLGGCLYKPRRNIFLAVENRMARSLSVLLQTATRAGIFPSLNWLQPLHFSAQSRLPGNSEGAGVFFHDIFNTKLKYTQFSYRASDGRFYGFVF